MTKHRIFGVYKGFLIPNMFGESNHVFLECTKTCGLANSALKKAVNYYYEIGKNTKDIPQNRNSYYEIGWNADDITQDSIRQRIKESKIPCVITRTINGRVQCFYSDIKKIDTFPASSMLILTKRNPSLKVKPLIIGETKKDGIYVNLGKELKVFNDNLKACIEYVVLCLCRDEMIEMQLAPQSENKKPSRTDFVVESVKKIIGEI